MKIQISLLLSLATAFLMIPDVTRASVSFGSGPNTFSIDFVNIGNAGNLDDAGAGGGSFSSPYGGVSYDFSMSVREISENDISKATASGLANVSAGAYSGKSPAANISWFEAAAFVNWLNTSKGHQAAYDLSYSGSWSMNIWSVSDRASTGVDTGTNPFRHKDAIYFLPSEDEWYKSAFHKNDGVTANYWDYATGSNTTPDGVDFFGDTTFEAVFNDGFNQGGPNEVDTVGVGSSYSTVGQLGNVWEWGESNISPGGGVNTPSGNRYILGREWGNLDFDTNSEKFNQFDRSPSYQANFLGFRVAAVPEPETYGVILGLFGLTLVVCRRRRRGLFRTEGQE